MNLSKSYQELARASIGRILVMDGPARPIFDACDLREEDYRGEMFVDHAVDLQGNDDILCVTAPQVVKKAHRAYLEAGADIIRTNTMCANPIVQGKFRLENMAYDIALAGARVACESIAEYNDDILQCKTGKLGQTLERKYVAGTIGPADDSANLGFRDLVDAYSEVARGLLDGKADIILLDSFRNLLNVKAALHAVFKVCSERMELVPVMVSGEIAEAGAGTLAGLTARALQHSVSSFPVFSIGLSAGENASDLQVHLKEIETAPVRMSVMVDVSLEGMKPHDSDSVKGRAKELWRYADSGLVNIVGGGRETTPESLKFMVKALKGSPPRRIPARRYNMLLSGLAPMTVAGAGNSICIGNVFNREESPEFAKIFGERNLADAVALGHKQIAFGAEILDVNLDSYDTEPPQIQAFMGKMLDDLSLAKCPVMMDSRSWDLLIAGIECISGKGIARSISLSEGEEVFLTKAQEIRKRGFALVCFAEDEKGAADTFARETEIIERMYRLLVGKLNFLAEDIVFEPCVEHEGKPMDDAVSLLFKVCRYVKANLPYAHILGDVQKLGLHMSGLEKVKPGLTSVFLHHAKKAGLDFYIAKPEKIPAYEEIPYRMCCLFEDFVLSRVPDAKKKLAAALKAM